MMTEIDGFDGLTEQERMWLYPDNLSTYEHQAERTERVLAIRERHGRPARIAA